MFQDAGLNPVPFETGNSHNGAALAVYNGSVDFATTFYSGYLSPEGGIPWTAENPDIPEEFIDSCAPNADGSRLLCGPNAEYRVLDARAGVREQAPDIVQKVRILQISGDIPNDTLSFGPDFPADLRAQIEAALVAFAGTDTWNESIGNQDFYGWTGIETATDAEYDFVRKMVEATGYSMESLGE
jgi:phosphonate transport system substrate-binding protein